jgi:hypothetical protein
MKSNAQTSLYFSAYPLKAFDKEDSAKPSTGQSPYLRAMLSSKTRTMSRVRIFPMVNPYRLTVKSVIPPAVNKLSKHAEPDEKEWFNNYE